MNVDAFILNPKVCDTGLTRIAPITQPDYRGLRANNSEIQHDILSPVDMHRTQPSSVNSRISVIETANSAQVDPSQPTSDADQVPPLRTNRIGVYLHWSLPRMYRAATSSADSTTPPTNTTTGENPSSSPTFRLVPNRWLVIRKIISSTPSMAPPLTAWVIESDRMWNISDLGPDVDLETDVTPFVSYVSGDESNPDVLNKQASVYIGAKYPLASWTEQGSNVPRVPLTVMNSSNFCFADNTIHNPNVFSMVDNFEYTDAEGNVEHYTEANCSYTVIGWHSSAADDPLGPDGVQGMLSDRLKILFCQLAAGLTSNLASNTLPMRLICYGTILKVQYSRDTKPNTPSDQFAQLFTDDVQMEPVSIGTTALDSVLTFLQAHSANEDAILGAGSTAVAKDILALSQLLYDTEDTYDSGVKAADLIFTYNFTASNGGNAWHYSGKAGPGQPPAQPGTVSIDGSGLSPLDYLNKLNDLQLQLDAANRKLQLVQWSIFALWWKYVADPNNSDSAAIASYTAQLTGLRSVASRLDILVNDPTNGLLERINLILRRHQSGHFGPVFLPKVQATSIALPPFYQRKDPTICIAGMDSGWPTQYTGIIPVEVDWALNSAGAQTMEQTPSTALTPLMTPGAISDSQILAAVKDVIEYAVLSTTDHSFDIGFKTWTGQPWVPLYIEWEATYFHIPFEKWGVEILNSPVSNNHDQVRYGIKEILYNDPQSTSDQRTVSGRIILTPQPTVNLQALVAQVLGTAGVAQPTDISAGDLVTKIGQLMMVSSELTGLTDNLITLADGTHVQPNLHLPGETSITPLAAAVAAAAGIGMTEADLTLIGDQSASTPFGSLVDFRKYTKDPFKPVTHGQFRFTKLNIIDKFGQVISGIQIPGEPRVPSSDLPASIHPCLGDQVCPSLIPKTSNLNTVTALTSADAHLPNPDLPGGYPLCPYVQLTPAINQSARINAEFVEPVTDSNGTFQSWKTTNDWDEPVWAWVVVNYADYGLQFFLPNGTFYVEMSLGGPSGDIQSPKWLPFDPPTNSSVPVPPQLDQLIGQMTGTDGPVYLKSFWDMITQAIENMPYAPADYSAYASSIVGKPLALVNVGFSLQLATPPLVTQSTLTPTSKTDSPDLTSYKFPVKIGDADRPFDGVLGYWDTDNGTTGTTDWTKLYTYFPTINPPATVGDPRTLIETSNFPTLSPFFVEPDASLINNSYSATLAQKLQIKTVLLDPYTALHVYSGILPIKELQLPAWTVQTALKTMSKFNLSSRPLPYECESLTVSTSGAFFHLGPCFLTKDVPTTYDSSQPLVADSWVSTQQQLTTSPETAQIRLPLRSGKKGRWNWLQPYEVDQDTKYNGFEVGLDGMLFTVVVNREWVSDAG
jgi:hypothetical protein